MTTESRTWHRVGWWRGQGVNAKWGKSGSGKPVMLIEFKGRWRVLWKSSWKTICQQLDAGESLESACFSEWALADFFSVPGRESNVMRNE